MNRLQKRACFKRARNDPDAIYCPFCDHKTRHVAIPVTGDVDHYDVYCEVCYLRIGRSKNGENGVDGKGYIRGRNWHKEGK